MTSVVQYEGNLRTTMTHSYSGSQVITDAPLDNHGLAQAFSPTDIVASALASCMLTIMGIKARDMDVDITGTRAEVTKVMQQTPRKISRVVLHIHLPELPFDERTITILKNAARTCPVALSLHPDIEQDVTFYHNGIPV